ncbi:Short-chain dehydrogenase/reductase SDR [Sphingobium yanoikuyae]|uniref:Short-chain dehydrogenase/reductase SDR n=1 Tax=Sphingobium yanoikuyae TaxID=13690 RepID=A0A084E942_SPHYA|nr:SDR family NAD(P)-dependent oxidoreductase [Sphingobium yanoikuyae]KEZ14484.1 Short-chain dehydrogenase/reductase SDR [Sphingobium yanoikuyae]
MVERARVSVVTGASSGIGKAIAKAMARQGWRVIGTGRDLKRLAVAEAEIAADAAGAPVTMLRADLSLLGGAAQLAQDIAALTDRVDLLFNNAGGMTDKLVMTDEGLEANFAGNHLGPFLLTQRLLPLLRKATQDQPAGAVRILNTASDASEMIPSINLDDMQNLERFSPGMAYCTGKLANVLFARALADRLAGDGIVAHAVHPGAVDSNFFSHAPADTQERSRGLDKASEAEGADTLVWLATAPEGAASNGGYWYRRAPRTPIKLVEDAAIVDRFWRESEKLIAAHGR